MFSRFIGVEFVTAPRIGRKAVIMRGGRSLAVLALGGAGVLAAAGCGSQVATAGPTATATAGLAAAATRTAAETARIAVTTTTQMQGMTVSFTESGAFDFARSRGTLTMSSPVGFTEVFLPPTIYIKMPAGAGASVPAGKSWIAAGPGMPGDVAASGFGGVLPGPPGAAGNGDPADLLASLTAISGSVTKQGTATIRGVPVTGYRVNIDLAKAAARVPRWERASFKGFAQSLGAGTIPVDVWVDSHNLVRRMREALHMPSGLGAPAGTIVTQTTDFYDFGVPVRVSAPPAAEVASLPQVITNGPSLGAASTGGAATPPPVTGTLSPAEAAGAEQVVRAFWTALAGSNPDAAAQTVPPAQRSCIRSLLSTGPKITVTSFGIVSARPAGTHRATVRFTVQAHATLDGTSVPVLPQGPGSQQWLLTIEKAGHWYADLASSSDLALIGACG
jgi:hypothetical protein